MAFTVALYLAVTLLGLLAGRTVNRLADRVAGDEDPPWRAGNCRTCGKPLPRTALPFLLGAWRPACPTCGVKASPRHPLLELALTLAFPLLLWHVAAPENVGHIPSWAVFLSEAAALVMLSLIFAIDLEHHLILYASVLPPAIILVAMAAIADRATLSSMLFGSLLLGGIFLLFYILGFVIYRQEALGLGDVWLAALAGLLLGWPAVTTALIATMLIAAAVSLLLLGLGLATRQTFIPFGTFIVAGTTLTLLISHPVW